MPAMRQAAHENGALHLLDFRRRSQEVSHFVAAFITSAIQENMHNVT